MTSVQSRSKSVGRSRFLTTDLKVDFDRPTENDFFPTFQVPILTKFEAKKERLELTLVYFS